MVQIRNPCVAGQFYPADRVELAGMVATFLREASASSLPPPKAIIAPHAGYIYSGPIAGNVYATLAPLKDKVRRVVLLGPAHRHPFHGIAATGVGYFQTPLGQLAVDNSAIEEILNLPFVNVVEQAYQGEHCLEVHLPFLQECLEQSIKIVPLIVGDATPQQVAEVIQQLWGGEETLVVISSDLSHYHDYETARQLDLATCDAIKNLQPEALQYEHACGRLPIQGLLLVAKQKGLSVNVLDYRNSGDTAGPKDQVVGYGAYHLG